jgi:hypothetical protein
MVRVAQNPKPYFSVSSETPPTWRARFRYLYPPGTGWPIYTPGHWVFIDLRSRSSSYFKTDSQLKPKLLYDWQSVSMFWYRSPLWDLRPDIIFCQNVAVWNLRSCIYGAPSLTRGRVCSFCGVMVRVAQNPKPYFTVSSETPPTWRARFPYLHPPGLSILLQLYKCLGTSFVNGR